MRAILAIALLLPALAFSQQPRVLPPWEIDPNEAYIFFQRGDVSTDPATLRCACMPCVVVGSTGEYVLIRMSCEDCNNLRTGDTLWLDVVPADMRNPRTEEQ